MVGGYDTGMGLLIEVVQVLDMASDACEAPEDAARFYGTGRKSPQLPGSQPSDHDPWNAPDPIIRESAHR